MRLIIAVALASALAAPQLADAQTATEGQVITSQGGPKRVRVPGADDAAQTEVAADAEVEAEAGSEAQAEAEAAESAPIEILPEANAIAEPEVTPTQATEQAEQQTEAVEAPEPEPATTEIVEAEPEVGAGPFVGDYTIGDPEAPVQIIEYASLTCPHCAAFHRETWPQFKEDFIDTGKVGFTMREVYFDRYGLWASMTARCAGEAGFYPMVDQFLKKQDEWTRADDIAGAIQQIGRRAGLTSDQLKVCLENQDFAKLLVEEYQTNAEADEVSSTPTFLLSGPGGTKKISGNMSYDDFEALVEEVGAGS